MLATLAGVVVLVALTGVFSAHTAVLAGFVMAAALLAWLRVMPRQPSAPVLDEVVQDVADDVADDVASSAEHAPAPFPILAFLLRLGGGLALGWLLASLLVAAGQIPRTQQPIIGAALGVLLLTVDFIRHRTRARTNARTNARLRGTHR